MQRRGYTLPLVLVVLGTLATAMTLMVVVLGNSARTTGSMIGRRQTLHACDGIVRGLMVKSRSYFAEDPSPTAIELRTHLCDASTAPGCPPADGWFPEMIIEEVSADTGSFDVVEEVPTGSFRGQMARRTDIALTVVARKKDTQQRCRVRQNAINSEIGLFQFAVFSAMPIELRDPPTMDIRGRVHVNGDFEAGDGPLVIEKVTAAGKILAYGSGFSIRDAGTPAPGTPRTLTSSNDSNTANFRVTSETRWHGNAQDESWGVPFLRLPVSTTAPVQGGRNSGNSVQSNSGMLRILIDPPRSSDDDATKAERFALKAAIRIINGVWYKNDGTFPGVPIWSDHPAAYTIQDNDEKNVVASTILATVPTSAAGPKRYSYYETDGAGLVANDTTKRSVVSYGPLSGNNASRAVGFNIAGVVVNPATNNEQLLLGARGGFVDGRVQRDVQSGSANSALNKGRILPLNFDVKAFVEALADLSPGELGAHFPTGLGDNAIVWIHNTWPGSDNGYPDTAASKPPSPSALLPGLPGPLCGGSGTLGGTVAKVVCSATGMVMPTAVRVWNAANIDPLLLPRGLSIISNGPMYVLGDTNTGSLVAGVPGTPRNESPTGPWVPFLVGGDAVTLQSNNWLDAVRTWTSLTMVADKYPNPCSTDANGTTYVMAVLGGHVERTSTVSSGGVNNFPRFLECWSGVTATIHGSLVAGYRSVYQDQGFELGPYRPPNRTWLFDPNLAKPANQPPGTPSFFVSAVERWQRD